MPVAAGPGSGKKEAQARAAGSNYLKLCIEDRAYQRLIFTTSSNLGSKLSKQLMNLFHHGWVLPTMLSASTTGAGIAAGVPSRDKNHFPRAHRLTERGGTRRAIPDFRRRTSLFALHPIGASHSLRSLRPDRDTQALEQARQGQRREH